MHLSNAEFIYDTAPYPGCHAATLAATEGGLTAAWFGGSDEGEPDVCIWFARREPGGWNTPQLAADGVQADGSRQPCWNPVLFAFPGSLLLFYKVGPSPRAWWGMLKTSPDGGATWSEARRLPEGILGPIKNKPVLLADGALLCPSSSEHDGWKVHLERTSDGGLSWEKTSPLADPHGLQAIQPSILFQPGGRLQIVCRTRLGCLGQSWSDDGGRTWTALERTALPNPNSGADAVTLADGRHLLIYNPTQYGRTPLAAALSPDGVHWQDALVLEDQPGEYSYPAVIQAPDGRIFAAYTWRRQRIRCVELSR